MSTSIACALDRHEGAEPSLTTGDFLNCDGSLIDLRDSVPVRIPRGCRCACHTSKPRGVPSGGAESASGALHDIALRVRRIAATERVLGHTDVAEYLDRVDAPLTEAAKCMEGWEVQAAGGAQ